MTTPLSRSPTIPGRPTRRDSKGTPKIIIMPKANFRQVRLSHSIRAYEFNNFHCAVTPVEPSWRENRCRECNYPAFMTMGIVEVAALANCVTGEPFVTMSQQQ